MERILYFDCFAGISGDMSIGALIDLGLDPHEVIHEIDKINISGYEIDVKKTSRFAIQGTDVKVSLLNEGPDQSHADSKPTPMHGHDHPHTAMHDHDHPHTHFHAEGSKRHEDKERSLADISHIIRTSGISEKAKTLAIQIFEEIARAEAAVHGKAIEEVHFHEVGAIDSIVDIVGAAICIDMLKVDRIYCSPVHEGQGFIHCRHGVLPVPVPAVVKMLEGSGIPIIAEDIQAELVTPTGFGILKTVSEGCRKIPDMLVERVGYGFGKTETGRLNALRVILGTSAKRSKPKDSGIVQDTVSILETNLDDVTGEALGYTMTRLLEAGALDVFYTPIYMKKNRPAYMLSVICRAADEDALTQIVFKETTTIGIRRRSTQRVTLERSIQTVKTPIGEVRVKQYEVGGLERVQPEYVDCVKLARENDLTLNEVFELVKKTTSR